MPSSPMTLPTLLLSEHTQVFCGKEMEPESTFEMFRRSPLLLPGNKEARLLAVPWQQNSLD